MTIRVTCEEHGEHVSLLDSLADSGASGLLLAHFYKVGGLRKGTTQPQGQGDRNNAKREEYSPGMRLSGGTTGKVLDEGIHLSRHTGAKGKSGNKEPGGLIPQTHWPGLNDVGG